MMNDALKKQIDTFRLTHPDTPVADDLNGQPPPEPDFTYLAPQLRVVETTPVPKLARKTIYKRGETLPANAFTRSFMLDGDVVTEVLYAPTSLRHLAFHSSTTPNLIMEGRRGTGKSHTLRWDMHMRAMAYPGFKYLVLRRTMGELRQSHLGFITAEMDRLGGIALGVRAGNTVAHYPNGSVGRFGHCETLADIDKYLSAEYHAIVFDEITTFEWDMITRISASCRTTDPALLAIVRGGTNPLGVSAEDVYRYFIGRNVQPEEDAEYNPNDWGSIKIEKQDNDYVDYQQYDKRFAGLSKAYQDAWRDGTWGVDGAYFDIRPEHIIKVMPTISGSDGLPPRPALQWGWLHIYRVLDYGFHDPTVCAWIAVLPDGHEIVFMVMSWVHTTAQVVAEQIKSYSTDMKVITTIADETLWKGEKEMGHCMAYVFEDAGIPLTKGKNDRTAAGFAIQQHLNEMLPDGTPKLLIIEGKEAGDDMIRTLKAMRVDKKKPGRIADHKADHLPIALGYFCMSNVTPTRIPKAQADRPWMVKQHTRPVMGAYGVRSARMR